MDCDTIDRIYPLSIFGAIAAANAFPEHLWLICSYLSVLLFAGFMHGRLMSSYFADIEELMIHLKRSFVSAAIFAVGTGTIVIALLLDSGGLGDILSPTPLGKINLSQSIVAIFFPLALVFGGVCLYVGVVIWAPIFLFYTRLPLYSVELVWQIVAFLIQRLFGRITLSWSPVLHHERSYLPLPTLAAHIVDTARSDLALARRALDACELVPGQRGVAKRAWPRVRELLGAQELISFAVFPRPNFEALSDLQGKWFPSPAYANGILRGLQEVGRYLRSAELTPLPNQRLEQIKAASDRLRQIENSLLGRRDFESRTYRPAIAAWRALIDKWLAETKDAAA